VNALPQAWACSFEPVTLADLDRLDAIEQAAYPIPWSRANFIDSLAAGYLARKLLDSERRWLGYFIAMPGLGEMHLLNLTVAPGLQRQGFGRMLLDAVIEASRAAKAEHVWLEVRPSNLAARALYAGHGFAQVGLRKAYYPAGNGAREDALVLRLQLGSAAGDALD
jgi:[ribosomal protein S18]-alanine N-acetyltransferase